MKLWKTSEILRLMMQSVADYEYMAQMDSKPYKMYNANTLRHFGRRIIDQDITLTVKERYEFISRVKEENS